MEEQDWAADARGIVQWVVPEAIEAILSSTPEDQELSTGKSWDVHRLKTHPE